MTDKISIVLADDHPIFRAGLRNVIEEDKGFAILGEAGSGVAAWTLISEHRPNVALVDISMPGLNGIALTKRVADECRATRILLLTLHEDRAYVNQAMQAGAAGYLLKRSASENVADAIRAVHAGGLYLDPAIAGRTPGANQRLNDAATTTRSATLTEREAEVLKLTALGETNKAIARRLDVSVKTIETFKSRAAAKFGLKTRAEIVRYAAGEGWLRDA